MSVYAIGDLQGCYDSYRRLLDKLGFDPSRDRIWLTGDLVNRGRKSLKTLRYVYRNRDSMLTVLGNHDLLLLKMAYTKSSKRARGPAELGRILDAPDAQELIDWLRTRPFFHYDESLNTALVHAGVVPEWTLRQAQKRSREVEAVLASGRCRKFLKRLYGDRPNRWSGRLRGHDRLRFIVNAFTRMRMLHPNGTLDLSHKGPPHKARGRQIAWFDVRHRKLQATRIVFGHWSSLGYFNEPNLVSLDTGCVWGRRLTAVRLDKQKSPVRVDCACERH